MQTQNKNHKNQTSGRGCFCSMLAWCAWRKRHLIALFEVTYENIIIFLYLAKLRKGLKSIVVPHVNVESRHPLHQVRGLFSSLSREVS